MVLYTVLGQQLNTFTPNAAQVQIAKDNYTVGTVLLLKVTLENGQVRTQKVIRL